MYNTTLVEIHPDLVSRILAGYEDDKYWARLHCQVQANEDLGNDKALLPFMTGCFYKSDNDPYMLPWPKDFIKPSSETVFPRPKGPAVQSPGFREVTPRPGGSTVVIEDSILLSPDKTKLLYHVNRTTSNLRLCILPVLAPDDLQIAHGEGHCNDVPRD